MEMVALWRIYRVLPGGPAFSLFSLHALYRIVSPASSRKPELVSVPVSAEQPGIINIADERVLLHCASAGFTAYKD